MQTDYAAHKIRRDFVCPTCGSAFGQKSHLTQHVKSVHLGEKPFQCEECGQRFALKGDMNRHIRSVHLKERPFKCQHPGCTRAFSTARHLRRHVLIHTGEKPYGCPLTECDYKSTRLCNLYGHIRRKHREMAEEVVARAKEQYSRRAPSKVKVELAEKVQDNPVQYSSGVRLHLPPLQSEPAHPTEPVAIAKIKLPPSGTYNECLYCDSSGSSCRLCALCADPLPPPVTEASLGIVPVSLFGQDLIDNSALPVLPSDSALGDVQDSVERVRLGYDMGGSTNFAAFDDSYNLQL